MVKVVCLKWGTKYSPEYVNRLYRMVKTHMTVPFSFMCITEDSEGLDSEIEIKSLPDLGLKGWWYKLLIFKPGFLGVSDNEKVLFLDLDVVILNSLDSIVTYSDDFCISADDTEHQYNSSVMCFYPPKFSFIWEAFDAQKEAIVKQMHGDQDWIQYVYQNAVIYPKKLIKSFKIDLDSKTPFSFGKVGRFLRKKMPFLLPKGQVEYPEDTAIVLFHGKPDPEDVMDGPFDKYRHAPWVKSAWCNE
ncbi:glycosyltransferase family protein [Hydrogenovibrio kuenenii]|uniref:hypothetical protein n=1 Tax=Hydrogenovibrio kuenenii TaxID=63658 RepID=UPI000463A0B9|nr:hypothetical protein [Hydrogenovibrio kuenenii]